ncbi:MAG: DUF4389 domain-containing protein [Chloroflexi bacterium]|nr:DUF4389 domain-containing protein [Chloroflexota bacterium]
MTTYTQAPPARQSNADYPISLSIDYSDGERNRLTVFFRIFTFIPIAIVLGTIGVGFYDSGYSGMSNFDWDSSSSYASAGAMILFVPLLLMIVFRQKYPRWWFDFNLELLRFSTRVGAYIGLLTDKYPSTDEEQGVHLTLEYPDATQLNRWLPLVKWLLAIPHYIVLVVLFVVAIVLLIFGWFAILFTGKLPRGIHDYLVGVTRWAIRVEAYALLLTTDKYPPFSLD